MGSLRSKCLAGFAGLVCYVAIVVLVMGHCHQQLQEAVNRLEGIYAVEEALTKVNTSVAHAILHVNDAYFNRESAMPVETLTLDVEAIQAGLLSLAEHFPQTRTAIRRLDQNAAEIKRTPVRSSLVMLRASVHVLVSELDMVARRVRETKGELRRNYRSVYDTMNLVGIGMGAAGIIAFGGMLTWFITRLASDLRAVERRAREVTEGFHGEQLRVQRHDEVGHLMGAINRMQSDLRERDRQLEITRQQRFHQEKMAAVGMLASAVAHEINNPISAIQGIAEMLRRRGDGAMSVDRDLPAGVDASMILDQTRRIAMITRQLSEMGARQPVEPQLLDLNELARNTCGFVSFDPRLRAVSIDLDLDPQLPAVFAVSDYMAQILMNLMINAADAVVGVDDRQHRVAVRTRCDGRQAELTVNDNGCGMDGETLERAFDEFFTTKPVGQGTGIGLHLCRSLIESQGGTIAIESTLGVGSTVRVKIPVGRRVNANEPLHDEATHG